MPSTIKCTTERFSLFSILYNSDFFACLYIICQNKSQTSTVVASINVVCKKCILFIIRDSICFFTDQFEIYVKHQFAVCILPDCIVRIITEKCRNSRVFFVIGFKVRCEYISASEHTNFWPLIYFSVYICQLICLSDITRCTTFLKTVFTVIALYNHSGGWIIYNIISYIDLTGKMRCWIISSDTAIIQASIILYSTAGHCEIVCIVKKNTSGITCSFIVLNNTTSHIHFSIFFAWNTAAVISLVALNRTTAQFKNSIITAGKTNTAATAWCSIILNNTSCHIQILVTIDTTTVSVSNCIVLNDTARHVHCIIKYNTATVCKRSVVFNWSSAHIEFSLYTKTASVMSIIVHNCTAGHIYDAFIFTVYTAAPLWGLVSKNCTSFKC